MKHPLLSLLALLSLPFPVFSASPEQVTKAVAEVEKIAAAEMDATGIPGLAIAVVYQDKVVFQQGFGVREAGKPEPVDADTVFLLASVSKPIGATVVASAVGEGKVTWDSRLSDLDPGFALSEPWVTREITVRDLYAHRSGLPDHAGDLLEDLGYTREEILHRLRLQQPDSSFRSAYAYTNYGITAAAVAVARAAGKDWEELSMEKLYRPLGMASTSSRQADFLARKNRARGHVQEGGKWVARFQRNPEPQSPAGGVSSSVNDLTKWLRLLLAEGQWDGKPLIAKEALDESHHPHMLTGFSPLTGLPAFYGLGWNVGYDAEGRLRLSHSGAFSLGAGTAVFLVPAEQLGIVVLTNAAPLGVAEAIGMTFLDLALYGAPTADWSKIYRDAFARMAEAEKAQIADYSTPPASPDPAAPAASYAGAYANDFFGDVTVTEKDGRLTLAMGPNRQEFPLKHWNRDTFTFESETETLVGTSGVFFSLGPDGRAASVTVENLNRLGQGTFVRKPKP